MDYVLNHRCDDHPTQAGFCGVCGRVTVHQLSLVPSGQATMGEFMAAHGLGQMSEITSDSLTMIESPRPLHFRHVDPSQTMFTFLGVCEGCQIVDTELTPIPYHGNRCDILLCDDCINRL